MTPRLLTSPADIEQLASRLSGAARFALDTEGNGYHAYRARLCVVQIAVEGPDGLECFLLDALVAPLAPLAHALGPRGPVKVIHDLSFDARLLHAHGLPLDNVLDTAVISQYLGIHSRGLAALVSSRLGLQLDKQAQIHDWALRPLLPEHLAYLAGDVLHLLALADHLAPDAAPLAPEIDEETRHRLRESRRPPDPTPAYLRLPDIRSLRPPQQAALRRLHACREAIAEARDIPAHRVAPDAVLVMLARRSPTTAEDVLAATGKREKNKDIAPLWAAAIAAGLADGRLPPEDAAWLAAPGPSPAELLDRQRREDALRAWRLREATERGVSEQVILPGHCLRALVSQPPADPGALQAVPGFGRFRAERHGEALLDVLRRVASQAQG